MRSGGVVPYSALFWVNRGMHVIYLGRGLSEIVLPRAAAYRTKIFYAHRYI